MKGVRTSRPHQVVPWSEDLAAYLKWLLEEPPGERLLPPPSSPGDAQDWQPVYAWFAVAAARLVPDFLTTLRENVFPVFRSLHRKLLRRAGPDHPSVWESEDGKRYVRVTWPDVQSENGEHLRCALSQWAEEFGLERELWIMQAILPMLQSWVEDAESREHLTIHFYTMSAMKTIRFSIVSPRWTPAQPWQAYKEARKFALDHQLEQYRTKEIELYYPGWRVRRKKGEANVDARVDLVLYQVAGLNYTQIANWWGDGLIRDTSGIYYGIRAAADEIGLTLRGGKPGRPRKFAG